MNIKKNLFVATATTALAIAGSLAMAVPAFAETTNNNKNNGTNINANINANFGMGRANRGNGNGNGNGNGKGPMMRPVIVGKVLSVSGNILTVSSNGRQGFGFGSTTTIAANTTFTVDASNATVNKNNATSTVSNISVGDTIVIQGTVSGTNIVATSIRDGAMMRGGLGDDATSTRSGGEANNEKGKLPGRISSSSPIQGNGQPVVAGTISAIGSSTISITNKSNVSYNVDVLNAKILNGNQSAVLLSSLKVGDMVIVQGPVNGSSIVASTVIDQTKPANTSTGQPSRSGFFGGIGQFFAHLFGF